MQDKYPHLLRPRGGYVFIVTYGRSGSTLVQNLLNSIRGYCIRGENNNTLFHLARAWHAMVSSEPMQGQRKSGVPTDPTHPWYGAELTAPAAYGRALADVFVREGLHLPPDVRVGGFKEIRFHENPAETQIYFDYLVTFFPNARFLFNTRSHEATRQSGWWKTMDPAKVDAELTAAEAVFDRMRAKYPDRSLHLHYDDYVGRPDAVRGLFDFLGEPFDQAMVERVMDQRLGHSGTRAG